MNFTLFNVLPKHDQVECLKTLGIPLAEHSSGGYHFQLYGIDGFYVELLQEAPLPLPDQPAILRAFDHTEYLDPYLAEIDLQQLTNDADAMHL